jgi:hypothetical protein
MLGNFLPLFRLVELYYHGLDALKGTNTLSFWFLINGNYVQYSLVLPIIFSA